jgi:hypothetical protein
MMSALLLCCAILVCRPQHHSQGAWSADGFAFQATTMIPKYLRTRASITSSGGRRTSSWNGLSTAEHQDEKHHYTHGRPQPIFSIKSRLSLASSSSSSSLIDAATNAAADTSQETRSSNINSEHSHQLSPPSVSLSFSHIHMYVDDLDDLANYKALEDQLNGLAKQQHDLVGKKGMVVPVVDVKEEETTDIGTDASLLSQTTLHTLQSTWRDLSRNCNITKPVLDQQSDSSKNQNIFVTQNRDIVRQLLAGFGFRVIGARTPELCSSTGGGGETLCTTRSLVIASPDTEGVQFVVTSLLKNDNDNHNESEKGTGTDAGADRSATTSNRDRFHHFDASYIKQFYDSHANRQGIAVLSFEVTNGSVETIFQRYETLHPNLLVVSSSEDAIQTYGNTKVLDVFAYYADDDPAEESCSDAKKPDMGTMIRFIEVGPNDDEQENNAVDSASILPGLVPVEATFDHTSQPAYCDHWVSNVRSRTGFLDVLEDTLGFTSKVNFNAGVIAAGESQIESTVTGNDAALLMPMVDELELDGTATTDDASSSASHNNHHQATYEEVLRDQSQVYLPINNALSPVGHVNGFLQQLGQGVQHIASRVENLTDFVQRANDYREITGEGFTFLNIPRSYYGVLTAQDLILGMGAPDEDFLIEEEAAHQIMMLLEQQGLMTPDGAVDLDLSFADVKLCLTSDKIEAFTLSMNENQVDHAVRVILQSRYKNVQNLLGNHLTAEEFMGIVRNRILVDVQGTDLLFQIFTCNILQRDSSEEAPFLEFIQRGCGSGVGNSDSDSSATTTTAVAPKPGCGGFGIRNFLTLFLSIEVSKAMAEAIRAQQEGNEVLHNYYQTMVRIFTDQLNESNPILNEISEAMTAEGYATEELAQLSLLSPLEESVNIGTNQEEPTAVHHLLEAERDQAAERKRIGNEMLMQCSESYRDKMAQLRADLEEKTK